MPEKVADINLFKESKMKASWNWSNNDRRYERISRRRCWTVFIKWNKNEDKRNKENVTEDVVELSSKMTEIKGEQIEEEDEECVDKYNITKIVPFITEIENIRRKSKKSGTMQQDFCKQEA